MLCIYCLYVQCQINVNPIKPYIKCQSLVPWQTSLRELDFKIVLLNNPESLIIILAQIFGKLYLENS